MNLPKLPDTAPFDSDQRAWINGFLSGYASGSIGGSSGTATLEAPPATTEGGLPVTILWGSQTGTSESLAKKAAKKLETAGHTTTIKDMANYDIADLSGEAQLLVITSTYGDGEPPDNAEALHSALMGSSEPKMENVHYSILALGDTEYADFCQCGKDFDKAFADRGAKTLAPRVDVDVDPDDPYEEWIASVLTSLTTLKT